VICWLGDWRLHETIVIYYGEFERHIAIFTKGSHVHRSESSHSSSSGALVAEATRSSIESSSSIAEMTSQQGFTQLSTRSTFTSVDHVVALPSSNVESSNYPPASTTCDSAGAMITETVESGGDLLCLI
jgi:hypothetical protein